VPHFSHTRIIRHRGLKTMLHTKSPPQVQVPTALLDPALPRLASLAVLTSFAAMS